MATRRRKKAGPPKAKPKAKARPKKKVPLKKVKAVKARAREPKSKPLPIRINMDLYNLYQSEANATDRTISWLVRLAMEKYATTIRRAQEKRGVKKRKAA